MAKTTKTEKMDKAAKETKEEKVVKTEKSEKIVKTEKAPKKKKLGFALGCGGSRGVAHIGFLQAMEDAGIKPDCLTGCSMGAVVGGAYASGMTPKEMLEAVCKLKPLDLVDITMRPGGLFDTRKMRKVLGKYLGDVTFDQLKIPFRCAAVDMITQSVVTFSEGSVADAVMASACIPAVFKPVDDGERRLVDGGVLERVPVRQLKEMGANKIVAVDVLGRRSSGRKSASAFRMLIEVLGVMDNHLTDRRRKENRRFTDLWLEPDLGDMSEYTFRRFQEAYDSGYRLGEEHAEEIRALVCGGKKEG